MTVLTCVSTGFLLDKKIGVNQPKRLEDCKILIANTPMDTDKIKVSRDTIFLMALQCRHHFKP